MSQTPAYVLNVLSPATGDVVSVSEMQTALRMSDETEADYLQALIDGAVELVQGTTARQLLTATYEMSLLHFPCREIEIPLTPLQSIDSIKYDDESGIEQTLAESLYTVELGSAVRRGTIIPAYSLSWPLARRHGRAVRVEFTCGYGTAGDVPATLKQQVRLLVRHWFLNRSAVTCDQQARSLLSFDTLQNYHEPKDVI